MKKWIVQRTARLFTPARLKTAAWIYVAISLGLLITAAVFRLGVHPPMSPSPPHIIGTISAILSPVLWIVHLLGAGFVLLLLLRCTDCMSQQGHHIAGVIDRIGKGDLGAKITLHRGAEWTEVADSVLRANDSLRDRIGQLQSQTRELSAAEEFLIDAIELSGPVSRPTLKALRKLKIGLNRLQSSVDDFEIGATPMPFGTVREEAVPERQMEFH